MSSNTKINQMKLKMLEIEKQIKEIEINEINKKKLSIEHNFKIINDFLTEKKTSIENNRYSKSYPLAKYDDQQFVRKLEALINILNILDNRLKKLEEK
jgi:hypothetical protein